MENPLKTIQDYIKDNNLKCQFEISDDFGAVWWWADVFNSSGEFNYVVFYSGRENYFGVADMSFEHGYGEYPSRTTLENFLALLSEKYS